jgi:DNA-binding NtrC family response regulator
VNEGGPPGGILGRIAPGEPERRIPASSVDVLLVHADTRFSGKVAGLLRKHAHTVLEVEDATEALLHVRRGCTPRAVVVDLDGAPAGERASFAALQAEEPCRDAAFLALSRVGDEVVPGLRPAITLLKPIEAAELVEAVRRSCGTLGG